jgi:hypothetical protein
MMKLEHCLAAAQPANARGKNNLSGAMVVRCVEYTIDCRRAAYWGVWGEELILEGYFDVFTVRSIVGSY